MNLYVVILSAFLGITATAGTQITCPGQNLPPGARRVFLDRFNEIRSQVAQGLFVTNSNVYARRASKMIRLSYNCAAEGTASTAAVSWCQNAGSSTPGIGEIKYQYTGATGRPKVIANAAVDAWWNEGKSGRLPPPSPAPQNIYTSNLGIPNFSKIVWDTHTSVGCSWYRCPTTGNLNVVCHFTPGGGASGTQMYKVGPPCNRCANVGLPTCSAGLCSA
ncbi:hypothetical protein RB195_015797 [Necator americanus]|uniref:SCP domain-containing protein n=1 Tax=Necator americanus TaxID=51031 RepID=A0ABR1E668_NECAM